MVGMSVGSLFSAPRTTTSNARLPGAKQLNKGSAVQEGWCQTWPRCLGSTMLPPIVRYREAFPNASTLKSETQ